MPIYFASPLASPAQRQPKRMQKYFFSLATMLGNWPVEQCDTWCIAFAKALDGSFSFWTLETSPESTIQWAASKCQVQSSDIQVSNTLVETYPRFEVVVNPGTWYIRLISGFIMKCSWSSAVSSQAWRMIFFIIWHLLIKNLTALCKWK